MPNEIALLGFDLGWIVVIDGREWVRRVDGVSFAIRKCFGLYDVWVGDLLCVAGMPSFENAKEAAMRHMELVARTMLHVVECDGLNVEVKND